MLFDYGTSSGLAYRHNFNADMARLLQEEGMINNQKAAAEAKAMKYGDEMKFATGYTPYFQSKIDEVANNNIVQIGKLLHENGNNPAASPMVWAQYKQLANQVGNNEWTVKSDAAKKEYEKFTTVLAEKPNLMGNKSIQKQLGYWEEFKEKGEYYLRDDQGNPTHRMTDFVFRNPISDVDVNKLFVDAAKNIEVQPKAVPITSSIVGIIPEYSDAAISAQARGLLADDVNSEAIKQGFDALTPEQQMMYGNGNIQSFVEEQIRNNTKKDYIPMYDQSAIQREKGQIQKENTYDTWLRKQRESASTNYIKKAAEEAKAKTKSGIPGSVVLASEDAAAKLINANQKDANGHYVLDGNFKFINSIGPGLSGNANTAILNGSTVKLQAVSADVKKELKHYWGPSDADPTKMEEKYYVEATAFIPDGEFNSKMGIKGYEEGSKFNLWEYDVNEKGQKIGIHTTQRGKQYGLGDAKMNVKNNTIVGFEIPVTVAQTVNPSEATIETNYNKAIDPKWGSVEKFQEESSQTKSATTQGTIATVTTQSQYDALPAGTPYIDSQGNKAVK